MMLSVVCWKWGDWTAEYVNKLRLMMGRHLHVPHETVCVTDDAAGIDPRVRIVRPPAIGRILEPRCRRRLWQYDACFAERLGERILSIDLDVVVVDDVTPLFDRGEELVLWKVGYAGVFCGSPVLMRPGVLDAMCFDFLADPDGVLAASGPARAGYVPSDQDVLNHYVNRRFERKHEGVPRWTDADGLVVNPIPRALLVPGSEPLWKLPSGARIVFMGGAERAVMEERRYPWIERCWR